nr:MAG TPA: acyl-protein synthetase [Caudoviricetes sp.]
MNSQIDWLRELSLRSLGRVYTNDIILEMVKIQAEQNPYYKKFLEFKGENASRWESIDDIAPIPIEIYKESKLLVKSGWFEPVKVWESSGTSGNSSRTPLESTVIYDDTIRRQFFKAYGHTSHLSTVAFIPTPSEWPHSSLAYMFDIGVRGRLAPDSTFRLVKAPQGRVGVASNLDNLVLEMTRRSLNGDRLFLYGISYLFIIVMEEIRKLGFKPFLGENPIVTDTGGYKGITRNYTREEFVKLFDETFSYKGEVEFITEYGMSELNSPFWGTGIEPIFRIPDWVQVRIDDETNQLTIFDPGLYSTCVALKTQDRAELVDKNHIRLLGRLPGASMKGCSISAERARR